MSARTFRVSRRGVTATFTLAPTGHGHTQGRVTLDVDPGTGPMSYQDNVTRWTIVAGDPDELRTVADVARTSARYLTPGAGRSQLLAWAEAVEQLAAVTL